MNLFQLRALFSQSNADLVPIAISLIGICFVIIVILAIWAGRYTKVGPNQVLVISGRRRYYVDQNGSRVSSGFRIVKGGGTFVIPVVEKVDVLSLEVLTVNVEISDVYTSDDVPLRVAGMAQIKVNGDDMSIAAAVENLLSKASDEVKDLAKTNIEGHLRAVIGATTHEEINRGRDAFASKVQERAARDLAKMGLAIITFIIRDIRRAAGAETYAKAL